MKANKHLPLLLLSLVLLWGLWYARPLDIYELEPGLHVDAVSVSLIRDNGGADVEDRHLYLKQDDAGYEELLSQMESLRFRRPPTNLLLYAFPALEGLFTQGPHVIHGHEYIMAISFGEQDASEWNLHLACSFDRWRMVDQGIHFPLLGAGAAKDNRAFGDTLWDMLAPA